MTDGIFPDEMTQWSKESTWWTGTGPQYTFYFDSTYYLSDITLSVDNNDDYLIEYTTDGIDWHTLFTIDENDGEITETQGGFDILSSIAGDDEYLSVLDFETVVAKAVRVSATDGDGNYAINEIQTFGTPRAGTFSNASFRIWHSGPGRNPEETDSVIMREQSRARAARLNLI